MELETVKSLDDLISARYKVRTTHRINPIAENPIINAVQQALGANPKRLGFIVINLGINNCWLAPNDRVADDYGYIILPGGGSVHMLYREDWSMVTLPWFVIGVAAPGTNIFVHEVMIF